MQWNLYKADTGVRFIDIPLYVKLYAFICFLFFL